MTEEIDTAESYWGGQQKKRHSEENMTALERWIREEGGGVMRVSGALGTHYVTIYSWLKRAHVPPLAAAVKMIELSKGKLTARQILEDTLPW